MNNNSTIKSTLNSIKADDELKQRTQIFIKNELEKRSLKRQMTALKFVSVALTVALIMVVGISGYLLYYLETAFISIDINPSIEFGVNRFDKVISVTAMNDDGKRILDNSNLTLKNIDYTKAIQVLLGESEMTNYVNENSLLSFTVYSQNKSKEQVILSNIEQSSVNSVSNMHCATAQSEAVEYAHSNGMSFGKYQAYLHLKDIDENVTLSDCHGMTMHQMWDIIDNADPHQSSNDNTNANSSNINDNTSANTSNRDVDTNRSSNGGSNSSSIDNSNDNGNGYYNNHNNHSRRHGNGNGNCNGNAN